MAQVTNRSGSIQLFADRSGAIVEISPGQTKPVDMLTDDPWIAAARRAGLIEIDEPQPEVLAPALVEKRPAGRRKKNA